MAGIEANRYHRNKMFAMI